MKTQTGILVVVALIGASFGICVPVTGAQEKSAGDAEKNPQLPAGLDTRFMDTTADPCVNFAQYACGNFSKLYPIPADMPGYGSFYIVYEHTEYALRSLLEKVEADNPSRTPNEQKIGDYYATCMDKDAVQAAGLKPMQGEFDRIAALQSKSELTGLLAHFQLNNVNAFFSYGEQQDFKDARKQIADVDQGGLGLPEKDYYLRTGAEDEKLRQQYVEHITNTFKLLGEPDAKAAEDAKKVMELETTLAKNSLDITSQRDPKNVYHITSVADLQKMTPAINWNEFLQASGAPRITDLNVTYPPFFKALN